MAVQSAARASSFFPGSSRHDAEQGRDGPTMARQNVAVQRKKENRRQAIAPTAQTERLRAMQGLPQHTNDKAKRKPAMRSNPDCSTAYLRRREQRRAKAKQDRAKHNRTKVHTKKKAAMQLESETQTREASSKYEPTKATPGLQKSTLEKGTGKQRTHVARKLPRAGRGTGKRNTKGTAGQ